MKNKAFGIGLAKTGTTTLTAIFQSAGYKAIHYISETQYKNLHLYDFASDVPVCVRYKDLYNRFPEAAFIYVERDLEQWLDSCRRHWIRYPIVRHMDYRREAYGSVYYSKKRFREVYLRHRDDINEFFKDKKLTTINICQKIGMEKLWDIIGTKVDIPKLNIGTQGN